MRTRADTIKENSSSDFIRTRTVENVGREMGERKSEVTNLPDPTRASTTACAVPHRSVFHFDVARRKSAKLESRRVPRGFVDVATGMNGGVGRDVKTEKAERNAAGTRLEEPRLDNVGVNPRARSINMRFQTAVQSTYRR